ncbi:MAG: O-methyltransferase [Bacilli bacterium]|nr:O-methyltransferase [Bacilli bacterium]
MDYEFEIRKMEKYADEKGVPIMEKDGITFLTEFVKLNKVKNILEVGTAIGYSAILMALTDSDVKVTSIERDKERYIEAVKNVKKFNLDDRITLVLADALEFNSDEEYDLIFIDAAKSQYIKFFEKFSKNLKEKGYVITDNINFHGLVDSDKSKLTKNVRGLVTKIEKYINFLKDNKNFKTRFFEIGDGIAISRKKKNNDEKDISKDK